MLYSQLLGAVRVATDACRRSWSSGALAGDEQAVKGIYFLGDDGVLDWVNGLLESLRTVCPSVTLYCIPFSDRIERLRELAVRYRFAILEDPSFADLDEIGRRILAQHDPPASEWKSGTFRKFCVFWGPLERFLYLDADIVVLDGFERLLQVSLENSDHQICYAHSDPDMVYKEGPLRERWIGDCQRPGINTGCWSGSRGMLSLDRVRELSRCDSADVAQFNPPCMEQPFLNYCLDQAQIPVICFDALGAKGSTWGGDRRPQNLMRTRRGGLRLRYPDGTIVPLIHWAGFSLESGMPHYHIYRHFRLRQLPLGERFKMLLRESGFPPLVIALKAYRKLRGVPVD